MPKPAKISVKRLAQRYKDVERQIVADDKISKEIIDAETQAKIIKQVDEEYMTSFKFNEAKRSTNLARLKIYNNQKRNAEDVGDPLLFTVFNTVHAALYDDQLMTSWEGRGGEGDEDVEENLNALSTFDYDIMQKNQNDFFWNWDAEFFGRGLMLLMDFDRTAGIMSPVPELIDAVSFIRDPRAKCVNGYNRKGDGAMRFGGWEVGATYYELKNLPGYFNLDALKKDKEARSLTDIAREERNTAQGRQNFDQDNEALGKYNNYEFQLLNWFTTVKGQKYLLTLGNRRTTLVRMVELNYDNRWPILDRALYPMAHDWDGVSIPDLIEDKQRARAVLLNLGLKSAKTDAMPQYVYDRTRIKNKNDLNWRHNKFVGVDGRVDNVIDPIQKSTIHQHVNIIMDILDTASQRATATPEIQQGIPSEQQRTLGEINLVSSKVDTRYSMSAKVYGWSEANFWRHWYYLYKKHFKEGIDEKVVRIQGPMAPIWRPLQRDNIVAVVDPDVKVESRVISEAKRLRERDSFISFAQLVLQDPEANRRYIEKKLAKLHGASKEEIDAMLPKTIEEMHAEDENEVLNGGKMPLISATDDHAAHLTVHAKANQTPNTMAHIQEHKRLAVTVRARPDLFPSLQPQFQPVAVGRQEVKQEQSAGTPPPSTPTQ